MEHSRIAALGALVLSLAGASSARAGEPTMPLSEVRTGMVCQAASVVRGEDITTFAAEVLDVINAPQPESARILIRVSGSAVDTTGVGPGFSGSPIRCPRADGSLAIAGAISEGIGEYGGKVLLATPIEPILATPIEPIFRQPLQSTPRLAGARPLRAPLTLAGVNGLIAQRLRAGARKAGVTLITRPATPRQAPAAGTPARTIAPGSAVFAGYSSGQIGLGALGTAVYTDGAKVWAFGHPFDGVGRRALFLQTARVSTVINNPLGTEEASTYKLGEPVADAGIISGDGTSAITGTVGVAPPSIPVRVTAKDMQTGRVQSLTARVADESAVGLPAGASPLSLVVAAAVGELAQTVLVGGTPARASGEICMRITLKAVKKPVRVCNRHVLGSGNEAGAIALAMAVDVLGATEILDTYEFGSVEPTDVQVAIRLRRGTTQSFVQSVEAPVVVRRGKQYTLRITLRRAQSGRVTTKAIRFRVPRSTSRGTNLLTVSGASAGGSEADFEEALAELFGGGTESADETEAGPRSPGAVAAAIKGLERYDGLSLSFVDPDEAGEEEDVASTELYRDPQLLLTGTVRTPVIVR